MNEQRALLHRLTLPVRWGDMDALGHVNSATYFTYMEQARVRWLESLGTKIAADVGEGPVIANATCTFEQPIIYPANLEVHLYGGPPGRSSFESYYELRDAARPDTVFAQGRARVVWVDYSTGRSAPLPAKIRKLLPAAKG
ncbi:MAG: thioesterase family protein [Acidiferrobacterales bacterium]